MQVIYRYQVGEWKIPFLKKKVSLSLPLYLIFNRYKTFIQSSFDKRYLFSYGYKILIK